MPEAGPSDVAKLVAIAGGEIVGRTRLQKIGCLLDMAGAGVGFKFTYHLFGPYSEQLTIAASDANALNLIQVEERAAAWGGLYSIYRAPVQNIEGLPEPVLAIAKTAANADSIELELAVTAAFLAKNGSPNAWDEIASRKKAKATEERLDRARILYQALARPDLPNVLPNI